MGEASYRLLTPQPERVIRQETSSVIHGLGGGGGGGRLAGAEKSPPPFLLPLKLVISARNHAPAGRLPDH